MIIDLTAFCDPTTGSHTRYDLRTPWVHQGWRYATDGRICVREPAPGEADTQIVFTDGKGGRPKAFELFAKFPKRGFTQEWPKANTDYCPHCGQNRPTDIAGRIVTLELVERIGLLSGVKFRSAGDPDDPVSFIADGGRQGVVMPLLPIPK